MTEFQAIVDAPASRRVRIGSLLWFLVNVGIQAILLQWLYRDCKRNTLLTSMTVFYVPCVAATLHAIGGLTLFPSPGRTVPSQRMLVLALGGAAATLMVAGAC